MFKLIGMSAFLAIALACAPAIAQNAAPQADQGPNRRTTAPVGRRRQAAAWAGRRLRRR